MYLWILGRISQFDNLIVLISLHSEVKNPTDNDINILFLKE